MPVEPCQVNGGPGFRWGASGKCYGYTAGDENGLKRARQLAIRQGLAIGGGTLEERAPIIQAMTLNEIIDMHRESARIIERSDSDSLVIAATAVYEDTEKALTDRRAGHLIVKIDAAKKKRLGKGSKLYTAKVGPLDGRISKDQADYRQTLGEMVAHDQWCKSCDFFQYDTINSIEHTCRLVEGLITQEWICDLWQPGSADPSQQSFDDGHSEEVSDPEYTGKALGGSQSGEWITKAEALRYTFAPVYAPTNDFDSIVTDAHNEFTTTQQLEQSTFDYVRSGDRRIFLQHKQIAGMRHKVAGEWVHLVQWPREEVWDFMLPGGDTIERTVPANTVYMGTIWEDWAWNLVQDGAVLGLSFGGVARRLFHEEDIADGQ